MAAQDIHPEFINYMPKDVTTKVGTILRSGWDDNKFDAIIVNEVLEHCIDLPSALTEIKRILSTGGVLIIVDKNSNQLASWPGSIAPWEQWFECKELSNMLKRNGFIIKALDANLPYEGLQDKLFFGIAAELK